MAKFLKLHQFTDNKVVLINADYIIACYPYETIKPKTDDKSKKAAAEVETNMNGSTAVILADTRHTYNVTCNVNESPEKIYSLIEGKKNTVSAD